MQTEQLLPYKQEGNLQLQEDSLASQNQSIQENQNLKISQGSQALLTNKSQESNVNSQQRIEDQQDAAEQLNQVQASKQPILQESKGFKGTKENAQTKICLRWLQGSCRFGDRCNFAHGDNQLKKPTSKQAQEPDQDQRKGQPYNIQWFCGPTYPQIPVQSTFQTQNQQFIPFQNNQQLQFPPLIPTQPQNIGPQNPMAYHKLPHNQKGMMDNESQHKTTKSWDHQSNRDSISSQEKISEQSLANPSIGVNVYSQPVPQFVVQQPYIHHGTYAYRPVPQMPLNVVGQTFPMQYSYQPQPLIYPGYPQQYAMPIPQPMMSAQQPLMNQQQLVQGFDNLSLIAQQNPMLRQLPDPTQFRPGYGSRPSTEHRSSQAKFYIVNEQDALPKQKSKQNSRYKKSSQNKEEASPEL